MNEGASTILGFCAACVPPGIYGALTSPGLGAGPDADFKTLAMWTLLFGAYSFVFVLVFGGPLFVILGNRKLISWWSASLSGSSAAIVGTTCLWGMTGFNGSMREISASFAMIALVGASSGFLFWLVWRTGAGRSPIATSERSSVTPNNSLERSRER